VPKIVVDTNVFIRLRGIYEEMYQCFLNSTDVMYSTKEIMNEYEGRAMSSKLFHIRPFIEILKQKKKLTILGQSYVIARVKRQENMRTFHYPVHNKDRKFVKVAIATKARYIISNDPDLLDLLPNRYNEEQTDNVKPSGYVEINFQT
jgi:putative PIN family toxin of toxin-antitoxin system